MKFNVVRFNLRLPSNPLKKLDLWEVSLVTFPANDSARVQTVKSIEQIESLQDAERHLRDAGMSRTEAKAFLSRLKGLGQRDAEEDVSVIIAALKKRDHLYKS